MAEDRTARRALHARNPTESVPFHDLLHKISDPSGILELKLFNLKGI